MERIGFWGFELLAEPDRQSLVAEQAYGNDWLTATTLLGTPRNYRARTTVVEGGTSVCSAGC